MNKKGFTLIEIIICISMLVIIGVGSFIGIRMVNKNLTIKDLNQITKKAIQASQVYIETNKEAQTQLYTEQNAVKIPLKVLVNEGLLSLKGTNLDNNKIEDEYVITALSTEPGTSTKCTNIDSKASWDTDNVIYICTNLNSKGEVTGSNLATIDPTKYNNKTYVSNEPYYFKGGNPNNYVDIADDNSNIKLYYTADDNSYSYGLSGLKNLRIICIDRNDNIIIAPKENFIYYTQGKGNGHSKIALYSIDNSNTSDSSGNSWSSSEKYNKWVRLPSSCKIVSGTGAIDRQFRVEC